MGSNPGRKMKRRRRASMMHDVRRGMMWQAKAEREQDRLRKMNQLFAEIESNRDKEETDG